MPMLVVTDTASAELKKVLDSPKGKHAHLVIYFQGAG